MNIFYLDENPQKAAQYHCDKHVVKMILEHAQMLSTTFRFQLGIETECWVEYERKCKIMTIKVLPDETLVSINNPISKYLPLNNRKAYMATHINHPCNLWLRESKANFEWFLDLTCHLCFEYTKRYNKTYKTEPILCWFIENKNRLKFSSKNLTKPALAMPEQYKQTDAVLAYRSYYIGEKLFAKWRYSQTPKWFKK